MTDVIYKANGADDYDGPWLIGTTNVQLPATAPSIFPDSNPPVGRSIQRITGPIPEWGVYTFVEGTQTARDQYYNQVASTYAFTGAEEQPSGTVTETKQFVSWDASDILASKLGQADNKLDEVTAQGLEVSFNGTSEVVRTDLNALTEYISITFVTPQGREVEVRDFYGANYEIRPNEVGTLITLVGGFRADAGDTEAQHRTNLSALADAYAADPSEANRNALADYDPTTGYPDPPPDSPAGIP